MSAHTLALLALVFSVTQGGINIWTLVRKLAERRLRRLEARLHIHALPPEPPEQSITVADIDKIVLKPRPK